MNNRNIYKILNTSLDKKVGEILPPELWAIVAEYWQAKIYKLTCPVSSEPFDDAAVINHPEIDNIVYNRESIEEAIRNGELASFGITERSAHKYIVPVTLPIHALLNSSTNNPEQKEYKESLSFLSNSDNENISLVGEFKTAIAKIKAASEAKTSPEAKDFSETKETKESSEAKASSINLMTLFNDNPEPVRVRMIKHRPWILVFAFAATVVRLNKDSFLFFHPIIGANRILQAISATGYVATNTVIDYHSIYYMWRRNFSAAGLSLVERQNISARLLRMIISASAYFYHTTNSIYLFARIGVENPYRTMLALTTTAPLFSARHIACADLALRTLSTGRLQKSDILSIAFGLCLLTNMLLGIYDQGKFLLSYSEYFLFTLTLVQTIISPPTFYIAARETTQRWLPNHDRSSDNSHNNESRLVRVARIASQISAAIFMGLLTYAGTESPLKALLAAIAMYLMGYLVTGIRTANNPYRLMRVPHGTQIISPIEIEIVEDAKSEAKLPLLGNNKR